MHIEYTKRTYKDKQTASLCLFKHQAMKTYGKLEAKINAFLTSTLDGLSYQLHASAILSPKKEPRADTPNGYESWWAPDT
jgi:hypothetical protein